MPTADPLAAFHPAVARWFRTRFPHGPTPPQSQGWPTIEQGQDTLIAAPTGTGKTLSAFLVTIDRFYRACCQQSARPAEGSRTRVVYVSPLKALAVDIRHNLLGPLAEIAEVARGMGHEPPHLEVAARSGDTSPADRARLLKRPPDILVTTPESLYLMVTAERSRALLADVETVIIDEIHALARDKRGSHLCLTLERLEHVARVRPVRIGLSATQRPIETVARLLVGAGEERSEPDGSPRCAVVDVGHRRELDIAIELPRSELEAVASTEQVAEVLDAIANHVAARTTTLVFVNTRRLAERTAHQLAERLGEGHVAAHHGSLSKERRQRVEQRLRDGDLKVLVATASLELGIDIGPVELVCQIGSPRSIATALQRIGRAGHQRFATPVGRLYPLTRDELVECVALFGAIERGRLDALLPPRAPLDVLAQQIVAECAAETWDEDALFQLVRRAAPYAELTRADYDAIIELVCDGVMTGRGRRAAYLRRDRINGQLQARRGARLAALTSGGAIPDSADYRVVADPDDTFVGTINEDFAIESMVGDVFLLGSTSWRIRRVERGVVRVVDAAGATPTIPFWLGEAPARTAELSEEVSALRAGFDERVALSDPEGIGRADAISWLRETTGVDDIAATAVADYLAAGQTGLGRLPTQHDIVFERFFDETGGMQLVVHAPFGGRINRALGLLLRKRFCTSFDFELQAAANDDAIVLSLGPQHSFPLDTVPGFLKPGRVHGALLQAVLPTPMFQVRWRWNLNRALLVLRFRKGSRNPPQIQRMESDDLMVALFPSLAACQDNATGPREIPDHPIVQQTLSDCFSEAMDERGLVALLERIAAGEVRTHFRDTTEPSVLGHEILNGRPYTFLDDAPLEERRTRAVQLRRGLPVDADELARLDPAAIARVREEAQPAVRDEGELHDLLMTLGATVPLDGYQQLFDALVDAGRALRVDGGAGQRWIAIEQRAALTATDAGSHFQPDRHPPRLAAAAADQERFAVQVLMGHLDILGPAALAQVASRSGLPISTLVPAVAQLESQGFAMRGHFDPAIGEEQICARRLLSRVHAYTQQRLRREIEPVSAQDFMRFLLRFQHVAPGTQGSGRRGVAQVIAQLQGFEAAVSTWEPHILAARVSDYRPAWLDDVCMSGEVTWGRMRPRNGPTGALPSAALSRAAPVTFAIRADLPWLLPAYRAGEALTEPDADLGGVAACLQRSGALFFEEIVAATGLPAAQVQDALWEGVARGQLTADGFQAARALATPFGRSPRPAAFGQRRPPVFGQRQSLRTGALTTNTAHGRWALMPSQLGEFDRDELADAVAEQLLARWGVVFKDVVAREALALPWRDVAWALRRLEARGVARGGRFVTGFVGEQYALPTAIETLRQTRRLERTGQQVRLNACDPLNLVGIIVPGARIPAVRTNTVVLCDGAVPSPEGDGAVQLQTAARPAAG